MGLRILHLSDLHISSKEDKDYQMLRNNIIKYIKENNVEIDVIAFTGDIIDRNDIEAYSRAIAFFDELLVVCNLSKDRLLIVPGNHDMERSPVIDGMLDIEKIKSERYITDNWKYLKVRMSAYSNFIQTLYGRDENNFQEGYGVKEIKIGEHLICFNLLNSAWSNKGKDDYRNLILGRWQLEQNREKIIKIKDKALVITMLHHPVTWFADEEADMLKEYLCHEEKFASNILLHGHLHDSKTQKEWSPSGGFISLMTGIGYPEAEERVAGQPKICDCRFSVYDIDIDDGVIDNFCLKSSSSGSFVPDTGLYDGSVDGHYDISFIERQIIKKQEEVTECMELDPIPVINCWSGRTEELDLLSRDNTNVITISGVGGQGKTALAAKFVRETPETIEKFNKKLWVDCRELPNTMHIKLLHLLESMTCGAETAVAYKDEQLSDTIKRFFKHISEERVLIVFDNVDAYVNLESEELVGELNDFIEIALTQQNKSLLILTCRTPIYDSRANFRTIKLDGLKEPEGIKYLQNRCVKTNNEDDINACKQIIRITKGHPWWLGLIAGQLVSGGVSPKEYLDENKEGILARDSQVEKFFGAIWEKFNNNNGKIAQNIIRYLAETTRPLTVEDLSILIGENYNKTSKSVKTLTNLNLLITHAENKTQSKYFQVHPLVREFIHKNYDQTIQKPFVDKLVELIIGTRLYKIIFVNNPTKIEWTNGQYNSRDVIDSIETCLTSRNNKDALIILSSTCDYIVDDGYHAEFLSLSERILDNIDWKKEEMGTSKKRAAFVSKYLDLLSLQDKTIVKVEFYLKNYENVCEKNTIPYSGYLGTKANILWRCEKYHDAWKAYCDYEEINVKTKEEWIFVDMKNLKGMILRDLGRIEEALDVFRITTESSAKYGNIARCYQLQKKYDLALDNLKICLRKLIDKKNLYTNLVNFGYAFLWIAEIYYEMGVMDKANKFLLCCQENWKEYAPGLLTKTNKLLSKLDALEIIMDSQETKTLIKEFLGE